MGNAMHRDDGQSESFQQIGQTEVQRVSLHPNMCASKNNECENITSNIIFKDTQIQLSCATLTRHNVLNVEKDLNLDYEVGG